jgi:hypothetical protein
MFADVCDEPLTSDLAASQRARGRLPRRRVRVASGVFAGMEGDAVRRLPGARWLIAIQPGVWIELDEMMLEERWADWESC